jgi:hypothetical protein
VQQSAYRHNSLPDKAIRPRDEPPRQIHQPLGYDILGLADGIPLGQQRPAMPVEFILTFVPYNGLFNEKPVFERMLRNVIPSAAEESGLLL